MRPGLLEEWCRRDVSRLPASPGVPLTHLVDHLAKAWGLAIVTAIVPGGAVLDLGRATIWVDLRLSGLGRAFVVARELAHVRMHRAAVDRLEPLGRRQTYEAVVWAATSLGFVRTDDGWRLSRR